MNYHIIDRYRDGYKTIDFCRACSKEGQELLAEECKVPVKEFDLNIFVSGLPDRD